MSANRLASVRRHGFRDRPAKYCPNRIPSSRRGSTQRSRLLLRDLRCELVEVVDAELLLDAGDLIDHLLEPLLAEKLVLLPLELLTQVLELLGREDLVE